jgi:hypothetical protein
VNLYLFGKPVQLVLGEELAPPIMIDISAIPRRRERVVERAPEGIAKLNV